MIINGIEVFHDHDDMHIPLNCIRIDINEIENIKERIDNYSAEEFDKVLFECGIERIKPSIESDYVQTVNGNKSEN